MRPKVGHDLQIDADLAQALLQNLRGLRGLGEMLLNMYLDLAVDRSAFRLGFGQELFRLVEIEFVGRQISRRSPQADRNRSGISNRVALQHSIDEALVVECMAHRATKIQVVERSLAVVHAQQHDPHRLIFRNRCRLRCQHALDLIGRQITVGAVDVSLDQRVDACRRLENVAPAHDLNG